MDGHLFLDVTCLLCAMFFMYHWFTRIVEGVRLKEKIQQLEFRLREYEGDEDSDETSR